MPAFDLHAFISYAHIDNQPLLAGAPGWVSQFHDALAVKLGHHLGGSVQIWRDTKLGGDDVFSDEILAQFERAALLVSVLTPRYLRSPWCRKELSAFEAAATRTGGVQVGNRSRVLKVVKTPLAPGDPLPPVLDRTLGVPFVAREGEREREIDPMLGPDAQAEFLQRVVELAVLMAEQLRALGAAPPVPGTVPPTGQVVFVAECGRDLQALRSALVTDLRLSGHQVLPEAPLPMVEDALRAAVQADLARATLAVHLVGSSPGPVPEGPGGTSLVALQAALGAERSAAAGLPRLLWLAPGAVAERQDHQAFLAQVQGDAVLQRGADLLRGDSEALKAAVHQALQRLRQRPSDDGDGDGEAPAGPRVHLVMTAQDGRHAAALMQALRTRGLQPTVPALSGDAAELRRVNGQRLAAAQAVLLLHGSGDAAWARAQGNELRRQAALAALPPRRWTVVAPPRSEAKDEALLLQPEPTLDLLGGDADAVADAVAAALGVAAAAADAATTTDTAAAAAAADAAAAPRAAPARPGAATAPAAPLP